MDLRAGSPAVERRTWSRSLRGPILAGPSPSCAHDDDRLRFPPISPAQNSKAGKKESTGRRRDRHCPPCARPSSNSSLDHRHSDARAAENGFAAKSSVNKSAKVVLERVLINGPRLRNKRGARTVRIMQQIRNSVIILAALLMATPTPVAAETSEIGVQNAEIPQHLPLEQCLKIEIPKDPSIGQPTYVKYADT